jgi:hypothetical protein
MNSHKIDVDLKQGEDAHAGPQGALTKSMEVRSSHRLAIAVLLMGAFLPPLDFFIVNLALPAIREGLRATGSEQQLIISGVWNYGACSICRSPAGPHFLFGTDLCRRRPRIPAAFDYPHRPDRSGASKSWTGGWSGDLDFTNRSGGRGGGTGKYFLRSVRSRDYGACLWRGLCECSGRCVLSASHRNGFGSDSELAPGS